MEQHPLRMYSDVGSISAPLLDLSRPAALPDDVGLDVRSRQIELAVQQLARLPAQSLVLLPAIDPLRARIPVGDRRFG